MVYFNVFFKLNILLSQIIPLGSNNYVRMALCQKAEEVKSDVEKVADILSRDSQALWVALHRSLAHKMDYHLSLCYPSDIKPMAKYLDTVLWSVFERSVGQHVPRREEGLGTECVLDLPIDAMMGRSFQELFTRLPIRLRGFGLRSLCETSPAAFIGGVEMALGDEGAERGWWRTLLDSDSRTGQEYGTSWEVLQREGEQMTTYLGKEFDGPLATGPAIVEERRPGDSCRQVITVQREELREAVVGKALVRHGDQSARPVLAYPQLDKLSTAWKLSLPGPTNGLTTPVFKEVMAQHLCLPSPACQPILGQPVGTRRAVVGPFADELMTATLPQDTWRTRHDTLKVALVNMCNEAGVPVDCEVFGLFQHLIPAELIAEGGELEYGRQRIGLCPDFKFRLQSADGPRDLLGELKFISAGATRYPVGGREKQVDRRARELPGSYRRPLERLDRLYNGTQPRETGGETAELGGAAVSCGRELGRGKPSPSFPHSKLCGE